MGIHHLVKSSEFTGKLWIISVVQVGGEVLYLEQNLFPERGEETD